MSVHRERERERIDRINSWLNCNPCHDQLHGRFHVFTLIGRASDNFDYTRQMDILHRRLWNIYYNVIITRITRIKDIFSAARVSYFRREGDRVLNLSSDFQIFQFFHASNYYLPIFLLLYLVYEIFSLDATFPASRKKLAQRIFLPPQKNADDRWRLLISASA